MAGRSSRDLGIDVAGLNDKVLIVLMNIRLFTWDEAGAALYALSAQHECCRDSSSVCDTACGNDWNGERIHDLRYQCHGGQFTDMSAGLGTLGNNCVDAELFHSLCKTDRSNDRNDLDAGFLPLLKISFRRTGSGGDYCDFLFCQDICDLRSMRVHQHNIYAERLVCQFTAALDLVSYPVRIRSAGTDDTQATGITYCSREMVICDPGHAALHDRVFDVQKFCKSRSHFMISLMPRGSAAFLFTHS